MLRRRRSLRCSTWTAARSSRSRARLTVSDSVRRACIVAALGVDRSATTARARGEPRVCIGTTTTVERSMSPSARCTALPGATTWGSTASAPAPASSSSPRQRYLGPVAAPGCDDATGPALRDEPRPGATLVAQCHERLESRRADADTVRGGGQRRPRVTQHLLAVHEAADEHHQAARLERGHRQQEQRADEDEVAERGIEALQARPAGARIRRRRPSSGARWRRSQRRAGVAAAARVAALPIVPPQPRPAPPGGAALRSCVGVLPRT
jgi:hypothetical protein